MSELLAVYGTLLSSHGAQDHIGVRGSMRFISECSIGGSLYALGGYPGFVIEADRSVFGELYEVDSETFATIDFFEQGDPGLPHTSLFMRQRVRLLVPDVEAWVYVFQGDPPSGSRIESGDFRGEDSAW